MANPEHLAILNKGVKTWNDWRRKHPRVMPDLSQMESVLGKFRNANLRRTNFRRAELGDCDLRKADLRMANLEEAWLAGSWLDGADLSGAEITRAQLNGVNLTNAKLIKAEMSGVFLHEANLTGADLTSANLAGANFFLANLTGANLKNANLQLATMVRTNLSKADLTNARVHGVSAWALNLRGAIQNNLTITLSDEPTITLDNLEIAQFIYLLLNNEKIRGVIDTITTKVVLILGRFTDKRKYILEAIKEELRRHARIPVLFTFDKPASRDITETVTTLARMSRYVIADISDPKSIPQEFEAIIPHLPHLPVQPIIQGSQREWGMFEHYTNYPWVLPTVRYNQLNDLLASLPDKVIAPAEAKARKLRGK